MEKKSRLETMFDAISDKNLYKRGFLSNSLPFLLFGLSTQVILHFLLNPQLFIIYVPLYVGFVFVTAILTKNLRGEFQPMAPLLAYLLLITSALSKAFALFAPFQHLVIFFSPLAQYLLVVMISEAAFLASLMTIVVLGQRISLRNSVGLSDRFFDKEKDRWKGEIEAFPNFDKILESLDGGRFVASLFDKGLFMLTILWSCNVMEEVIDAITEGILDEDPKKKTLFRNERGFRLAYPLQIKNLGYEFCQDKMQLTVETLWHRVRNKIAHHNYRPTFEETNKSIMILTSFIKETPVILQKWSSS